MHMLVILIRYLLSGYSRWGCWLFPREVTVGACWSEVRATMDQRREPL